MRGDAGLQSASARLAPAAQRQVSWIDLANEYSASLICRPILCVQAQIHVLGPRASESIS